MILNTDLALGPKRPLSTPPPASNGPFLGVAWACISHLYPTCSLTHCKQKTWDLGKALIVKVFVKEGRSE